MEHTLIRSYAKVVKNSSYYSRYQTPFRRRGECKTDYCQRTELIKQDKTKYGAAKYRLVARVTNTKVIAQIVAAKEDHDETLVQANSKELVQYGIKLGLTNYASAYCVGLLCARRLLKKLGIEEVAKKEEEDDERRPFKAVLDVGLRRTTTGARVFAVMKGAVDGGIFVPHDEKFKRLAVKKQKDKVVHDQKYYLCGGHVADYMKKLQEEDAKAYERQFSRYIKEGITHDKIVKMYKDAQKAIRENPEGKSPAMDKEHAKEYYRPKKPRTPAMSPEEKKRLLNEKLVANGLPPRE